MFDKPGFYIFEYIADEVSDVPPSNPNAPRFPAHFPPKLDEELAQSFANFSLSWVKKVAQLIAAKDAPRVLLAFFSMQAGMHTIIKHGLGLPIKEALYPWASAFVRCRGDNRMDEGEFEKMMVEQTKTIIDKWMADAAAEHTYPQDGSPASTTENTAG